MSPASDIITPLPHDDVSPRVRHLLATAYSAFLERGYEAVSLDAVAREAGVSKETIYRHFTDKEALFRAAMEGERRPFSLRVGQFAAQGGAAWERLARYARAIHDSAVEGGYLAGLWLTISIARQMPETASLLLRDSLARMEPLRQELAHIAAGRGKPGVVPLELAADFGALAVEGPLYLMGAPKRDPDGRALHAKATSLLFLDGALPRTAWVMPPPLPCQAPPPPAYPAHIARLLTVAADQFRAQGFQAVSLNAIGAAARAGRGTLYRHFGSKAQLFAAAMRLEAARLAAAPTAQPYSLSDYLAKASAALTSADAIALQCATIAEARRDPALALDIHQSLRAPWRPPLARWLATAAREAQLPLPDPDWLAGQVITLATIGNRPLSRAAVPDETDRRQAVGRALAILDRGFTSTLRTG